MKKKTASVQDREEALKILKNLSHPLRLSILCHLVEQGEMNAGNIVELEMENASQSQISQYLNTLKNDGLITSRREGQFQYYKIADRRLETLMQTLHELFCKESTSPLSRKH